MRRHQRFGAESKIGCALGHRSCCGAPTIAARTSLRSMQQYPRSAPGCPCRSIALSISRNGGSRICRASPSTESFARLPWSVRPTQGLEWPSADRSRRRHPRLVCCAQGQCLLLWERRPGAIAAGGRSHWSSPSLPQATSSTSCLPSMRALCPGTMPAPVGAPFRRDRGRRPLPLVVKPSHRRAFSSSSLLIDKLSPLHAAVQP